MQFFVLATAFSAIFAQAFASPVENGSGVDKRSPVEKRSSCQVCDIGPWGAGDACCSASCLAQFGDIHGGHCDDNA